MLTNINTIILVEIYLTLGCVPLLNTPIGSTSIIPLFIKGAGCLRHISDYGVSKPIIDKYLFCLEPTEELT
jgi:hypothetical protein